MTDKTTNEKLAQELCEQIQIFIDDAVNLLYVIDSTNAFNKKPEAHCIDETEKLLEYASGFTNKLSTVLFDIANVKAKAE